MRHPSLKYCCFLVLCLVPVAAFAQRGWDYDVTITNVTRGQILSPPVVVSHDSGISLFELGQPASDELAALAEDGAAADLIVTLMSSNSVHDVVQTEGAILPGESATVRISVQGHRRLISFASMLVTTNDTFAAAQGLRARPVGTVSAMVPGYDAGSEDNNELCAYIPGPPCGSAFQRDEDGAEGYVHVSSGVQGTGDLDGAHDWRNPVARISIRRAR